MISKKAVLLLLILLNCQHQLFSQSEYRIRKFSKSQLEEDFHVFKNGLIEMHPGLNIYTSADSLNQLFTEAQLKLKDSLTDIEFYRVLAPIVNAIRCGHTQLYPNEQYFKYSINHEKILPISIKIVYPKMYVRLNNSNERELQDGDEIVSINGFAAKYLIDSIANVVSTDGYSNTMKYREAETGFPFFHLLLFPHSDVYELKVRRASEPAELTYKVQALLENETSANYSKYYPDRKKRTTPALSFFYDDSLSVGYLKVKTFQRRVFRKQDFVFKRYIRSKMKMLKKNNAQHLVVDLRNNEGGDADLVPYLYKKIAQKPFQMYDSMTVAKDHFHCLKFTDRSKLFNIYLKLGTKKRGGIYVWRIHRYLQHKYKPSKNNFQGKVYVLINGQTFSAASTFAALADYYNRAEFIGEETGGSYSVINAADILSLKLPHTKVFVRVPIVKIKTSTGVGPGKGRGVIPDHPIIHTQEDIKLKNDPELIYTIQLIRKRAKA